MLGVMFWEGTDFTVLDRSRDEWGEAADEVSSMTINYLFFSSGCSRPTAKSSTRILELFELFFELYLEKRAITNC